MRSSIILGILIASLLMVGIVAGENTNFTQQIPEVIDDHITTTYVNTTYSMAETTTTPFFVWVTILILAFGTLFLSAFLKPEQCNDFFAYISPGFFIYLIYASFGIDVVTSYGITSQGIDTLNRTIFASIENHTVYHPESFIVFSIIFFGISMFNAYRVMVQHKELKSDDVKETGGSNE